METVLTTEELLTHGLQHVSISIALWIIVICAILLDLWDGIYTARKTAQRVHSHKLRVTVAKISEYWRLMLIGFCIDTVGVLFPFYALPFLSIVLCVGLVCVEGKSMIEHAKRRKSKTLELKDIYQAMIAVATEADAKKIMAKIGELIGDKNGK